MPTSESTSVLEMRYAKWLFLGPAAIHLWWARCVLHSDIELHTTGLFDLYRLMWHSPVIVATVLIVTSIMSVFSVFTHERFPCWSLSLLLPQQVTMLVSAITAWRCIMGGHFADGATYNSDFISADQCYIFAIGCAHTALIIHVYIWDGIKLKLQHWWNQWTRA